MLPTLCRALVCERSRQETIRDSHPFSVRSVIFVGFTVTVSILLKRPLNEMFW